MKRLTQDEFIEKCKQVHGERFDYTKTMYINTRTDVIITCRKHGDVKVKPDNHIRQKQGCFNCFLDKHKLTSITNDRLDNLKRIHNNRYSYDNLQVVNGQIEIICKIHGKFEQSIYNHERGHGCSECNSSSRGEDRIKSFLDNHNIRYYRNYQFEDCRRSRKLRFDFYLPYMAICIEYDGEHHFEDNEYFGEGNLDYIRENDEIKNSYCDINSISIVRIPYWDYDSIDTILKNKLVDEKV